MKKRILFIVTQSEFGGAQRFLSNFVPRLDSSQYEILVATGTTGDQHFQEHFKNLGIATTTLTHLVRPFNPYHDWKAVRELQELYRTFAPDVLFLLSSKAGWLGAFAARHSKMRVIYRIGGWAFNDPQSWLRRQILTLAERISARWKDVIIVNNKHDLDQATEKHIRPRNQVVLIHNGLDVYKIKFLDREKARERLQVTTPLVVGTIANFYPSKGLPQFVAAAKAFADKSDVTFVVIGAGDYQPPKSPNVLMPGRIPEAARLLPAFDIFISPSLKEGFPWAILEAMAAKVPVIATRVGAAPEIIQDGVNGFLVEPGKPERIVDRLHQLLENRELRQSFSIHGHQTVLHSFDLERMVTATRKLLDA